MAPFHVYSSLGSNLQPSVDTWENLFAALVSVLGLLLFLYLIGNLQVSANIFIKLDHALYPNKFSTFFF